MIKNLDTGEMCHVEEACNTFKEVEEAEQNSIALSTDEQLAFWNALNEAPRLTSAQKKLGAIMRGEE